MKAIKVPHVFTLLTAVVFVCSLLTFMVPSGEYDRAARLVGGNERTIVVPGTYRTLPKHISAKGLLFRDEVAGMASPVSLEGFLSAIPRGMVEAGDIIFFIFIITTWFFILAIYFLEIVLVLYFDMLGWFSFSLLGFGMEL